MFSLTWQMSCCHCRLFPSYLVRLFQNESLCKTFCMKMNSNDFHKVNLWAQGFHLGWGTHQIDMLWGQFCMAGLTILSNVFLTKKFSSNSFVCLWKPVSLLLKTTYWIPWDRTHFHRDGFAQRLFQLTQRQKAAHFPYVTFVSVVSFNDVTIPACCFCWISFSI